MSGHGVSGHNARAIRLNRDPDPPTWHGSCASCGYWGRACKTVAGAERQSDRHNAEAQAEDEKIQRILYGGGRR